MTGKILGPNGHQPPEQPEQPQNPFGNLGLGKHFQPSIMGWKWIKMMPGSAGAPIIHVLVLSSVNGIQGFTLTEEDLRKFVGQAYETLTGLVLPL